MSDKDDEDQALTMSIDISEVVQRAFYCGLGTGLVGGFVASALVRWLM